MADATTAIQTWVDGVYYILDLGGGTAYIKQITPESQEVSRDALGLAAADDVTFASVTASNLTSGRIPYASVGGKLVDDGDMSFSTDTLTAQKVSAPTSVTTPIIATIGDLTVTCGTNKTLVLYETVWDDFPPNPIVTARLGSSAPTLATFVGNIEQYTFDATNDYVVGSTEIPHGWKEGTVIYPHIHWASNGSEVGNKGVKWQLEYSAGDISEAFGGAATLTCDVQITGGTTDRTHFVSNFSPTMDGANWKIGNYITWRLNRIATENAGGAPAANPFALAIGFHGEFDTLGSRETTSK
jgi:hypothetical protein